MTWKDKLVKEVQDMYNINSTLDDFAGDMIGLKEQYIAKLKQMGYAGAVDLETKLDTFIREMTAQ
tara:strand:+ start:214 stop:408 length:195 start_codon:yes stop_codon:yes gene_type:complete